MIQQKYSRNLATIILLQTSIFEKIRNIAKMSYFEQNLNPSKRVGMDGVFLSLAGLLLGILEFRTLPSGNPSEQPCQPEENPVHPSSFTWINPLWQKPMDGTPGTRRWLLCKFLSYRYKLFTINRTGKDWAAVGDPRVTSWE